MLAIDDHHGLISPLIRHDWDNRLPQIQGCCHPHSHRENWKGLFFCFFGYLRYCIGHSLISPIHVLLGDVVEWNIAIVVFKIVETPFSPSHQILDFMPVRARIPSTRLVAVIRVGTGSYTFGPDCAGEILYAIRPFCRICKVWLARSNISTRYLAHQQLKHHPHHELSYL